MPREVDGLLDTIDELVDESLTVGPVDDYNTNRYDKCWHCDRDWHGIPITERIEQMRWSGRFDEGYRLAEDDSPVLCPGSDFIGPVRARISRTQADIFARASESLLSTLSLVSRQPSWSGARWWKTVLPADGQYLYDTVESRVTIRIGGPGGPEVTVNAEHFRALHEDSIEDIYAEATRTRPGRIIVHVLADTAPRIGGTWTPITAPGVTAHPSDYPRRPTLRRDLNFGVILDGYPVWMRTDWDRSYSLQVSPTSLTTHSTHPSG